MLESLEQSAVEHQSGTARSRVLVRAAPKVVELEPALVPIQLRRAPDRAAAQLSDRRREVRLPLHPLSRIAMPGADRPKRTVKCQEFERPRKHLPTGSASPCRLIRRLPAFSRSEQRSAKTSKMRAILGAGRAAEPPKDPTPRRDDRGLSSPGGGCVRQASALAEDLPDHSSRASGVWRGVRPGRARPRPHG